MKALITVVVLAFVAGCSGVGTKETADSCVVIEREQFNSFFFDQRVRPQPVYRNGEFLGWRLYEQHNHEVLPKLGLRVGDLVTHFCGASLPDILSGEGKICCSKPVGDSVDLTVVRDGQTLELQPPMPPNNALQATREDAGVGR